MVDNLYPTASRESEPSAEGIARGPFSKLCSTRGRSPSKARQLILVAGVRKRYHYPWLPESAKAPTED